MKQPLIKQRVIVRVYEHPLEHLAVALHEADRRSMEEAGYRMATSELHQYVARESPPADGDPRLPTVIVAVFRLRADPPTEDAASAASEGAPQ